MPTERHQGRFNGSPSLVHACLHVDEILRLTAHELVVPGAKTIALALACCCESFEARTGYVMEDPDPAVSFGHSIYRKGSKETSVSVMDVSKHR